MEQQMIEQNVVDNFELPNRDTMRRDLRRWRRWLDEVQERLPWSNTKKRDDVISAAKLIRKMVAETWIHLQANHANGDDPHCPYAIRAYRSYRMLKKYGKPLRKKQEKRLTDLKQIPEAA